MSVLTEWFEGRQVEEPKPKQTWLSIIIEILCMVCLGALVAVALPGCASSPSPRSEVCAMRLLGQTQDGMSVVAVQCVTPEQFAESQK